MIKPREGRRTRTASTPEPEARAVAGPVVESPRIRAPRPLLPPLKVGREWDRVRRIAYL
jgi:hypothetical protein